MIDWLQAVKITNAGEPDRQSHFWMGVIGACFGSFIAWLAPVVIPIVTRIPKSADAEIDGRVVMYRAAGVIIAIGCLCMAIANFDYR